jgi:hypothetical protein
VEFGNIQEIFRGHDTKFQQKHSAGKPQMFSFSATASPRIAVLTSSSTLPCRLWRQNKVLDRTPHTDHSNFVCLIGARRRSAPRLVNILFISEKTI